MWNVILQEQLWDLEWNHFAPKSICICFCQVPGGTPSLYHLLKVWHFLDNPRDPCIFFILFRSFQFLFTFTLVSWNPDCCSIRFPLRLHNSADTGLCFLFPSVSWKAMKMEVLTFWDELMLSGKRGLQTFYFSRLTLLLVWSSLTILSSLWCF